MLEDTAKGVVYLPVRRALLPALKDWSEPVRIRLVVDDRGEAQLEIRALGHPRPDKGWQTAVEAEARLLAGDLHDAAARAASEGR